MRSMLFGWFLMALCAIAHGQTRTDITMVVDTAARNFIVVVPSHAPPAGGYPMVFMLHGTSGDGEKFYNISQWKEKGEAENFVTVFPSSLRYCFYTDEIGGPTNNTTKWKNGEAVEYQCPGVYMKDDVAFIRKMIDTICATLPIDKSRVYAAGFSNGGGMVSKLAIELSDKLAAIQASSGTLNEHDLATAKRSLPVWWSLGSLDDRWTVPLGVTELPFNDTTAGGYLRNPINRYLTALGLTEDYTKDSTALTLTYTFSTPSSSVPVYEFKFSLIKGLEHSYPNGTNFSFAAPDIVWPWFRQFSIPQTTSVPPQPQVPEIKMYPNPASNYITLSGEGECMMRMYSVLGQLVFQQRVALGSRVALPQLVRGVYQVVLETMSGNTSILLRIG